MAGKRSRAAKRHRARGRPGRGPQIGFDDLPPEVRASPGAVSGDLLAKMPYREVVNFTRDKVSRDYRIALMRQFGGNVTRAAEQAGVERESLHRLLKRYGVRSEDFKQSE